MGATGKGTISCALQSQLKNETRDSSWTQEADTIWFPPRRLIEWICRPMMTRWWTSTLPMASLVQPNGLTSSLKPLTSLHKHTSWRTHHQWCRWANDVLTLVAHSFGRQGRHHTWLTPMATSSIWLSETTSLISTLTRRRRREHHPRLPRFLTSLVMSVLHLRVKTWWSLTVRVVMSWKT